MRQFFFCIYAVLLTAFIGCDGQSVSERLSEIDSLVINEQYDSAYKLVKEIEWQKISDEDITAHYWLLNYQTSYLANKDLPSDSILDWATQYYKGKNNTGKLAECYYYKAYHLFEENDFDQSVIIFKKAEEQSLKSRDVRQQFKIAEALSLINGMTGNYAMSLEYGKKAMIYAENAHRKDLLAYSYHKIGHAFHNLGIQDSAMYYFEKTSPYIKYIRKEDRPYFLNNLSLVYINDNPQQSKKFLEESISQKELVGAMEQLASIYYDEGNTEEAYKLWTKALTISSLTPKDNIIHNLLEYDLEHGRTDKVCERVNEIIAIKDSVIDRLKNDTIKDLQTRFDHEVAMNAANRKLIWWQTCLGIPAILLLFLTIIWIRKQQRTSEKLHRRETEIKNLIGQLDDKRNQTLSYENRIAQLEKEQQEGCKKTDDQQAKIQQLRAQKEAIEEECHVLGQRIENWAGAEAEKVRWGALLMNEVNENKSIRHWSDEKQEALIAYYCALHKNLAAQIKNKQRNLTLKQTMYLILCDMKKTKNEMSAIMGVDMNTLRTYKFRITKKE